MRTSVRLGLIVLVSLACGAWKLLASGEWGLAGSVLSRAHLDSLKCKRELAGQAWFLSVAKPGSQPAADFRPRGKCPVSRKASYRYDPGPPARLYCEGTHHQPYFKANEPVWTAADGVVAGDLAVPPGFPFGLPPQGKLIGLDADPQSGVVQAVFSYAGDEAAVLETYKGLGEPVRNPATHVLHLRGKTATADELTVSIMTEKGEVVVRYAPAYLAD